MVRYAHLIDGCVGDVPHAPGDLVSTDVSAEKVAEWLAAGIVEPVKEQRASDVPVRKKTRNAPVSAESQGVKDDNRSNSASEPAAGEADQLAA